MIEGCVARTPSTHSPNGDNKDIKVGAIGKDLEGTGPLPGDDGLVIVGMHELETLLVSLSLGEGCGFLQILSLEHHVGTEHPGVLYLDVRREPRHHDRGGDAKPLRVVRDGLRMIACGHRDHTLVLLTSIHGEEFR